MFAGAAVSGSADSAIVWFTAANGNNTQPGTLHALDASDLAHELWNSDMLPENTMGRFAKMVAPTVANGKVYVPTFSNELVIYGLLNGGATPETGPPQVTAVTNGANFLGGAIAPGELLAIFGANLGPSQLVGAVADSTGHLSTKLAHTKVFIDGVASPLVYASANQVGALVPFGISSASTQVIVQNGSDFSNVL